MQEPYRHVCSQEKSDREVYELLDTELIKTEQTIENNVRKELANRAEYILMSGQVSKANFQLIAL